MPGRKTDVSDAQWLQRLHSHGLLRASFRPKGEIVELRAYLRQRERLLEYARIAGFAAPRIAARDEWAQLFVIQ